MKFVRKGSKKILQVDYWWQLIAFMVLMSFGLAGAIVAVLSFFWHVGWSLALVIWMMSVVAVFAKSAWDSR